MCPNIQLENFISEQEALIDESLIFVDDYDIPEIMEDLEFYRDMPELLIYDEYFYDRPELDSYYNEYINENEYVREDNQ